MDQYFINTDNISQYLQIWHIKPDLAKFNTPYIYIG